MALLYDLSELVSVMIALDKKEIRLLLCQTPIPRENQAVFGSGRANQPVSAEVRTINDILPDHAEPFDKPSEHSVRGKLYI